MNSRLLLTVTALLIAPNILFAQEGTKPAAAAPADPKRSEHDALKQLAGDWQVEMKMEAMPGVPGMETASESKGSEHAELICNGLWLRSVINATHKGAPFQGTWLAGFDPHKQKYVGYWVSSDESECGLATMDGSYDAGSKTWTWSGSTPQGEMRSTMTLKDADRSVETCFMKGSDGKEVKCMEITRQRAKTPAVVDASSSSPKLSKELEVLQQDVGNWEAQVKCVENGKPAADSKGSERVVAICNNRWLWSDFTGQMQGQPFEGHALIGYDVNEKKYVSLWIDSMSPVAAKTTGTFDASRKAYVLEGTCVDPSGKPVSIKEVVTTKDNNTRVLQMECKGADGTSTMEITYKRKG